MPIISRNPAVTLELCFAWQKLRHSEIDPSKPSDYVKKPGNRHRITRDKLGNIVNLPVPRHDVIETKRGRMATTNRVVTGHMVGRVLAAALNQPPALANFLQFMYDPECPRAVVRNVEEFAKMKMKMLVPAKAQQAKRDRCQALVRPLMLEFSQRVRTGLDRYTEAQLCQYMGFANKQDAHYDRDYKRLVGDFMLQLQDAETQAMAPVCDLIDKIFRDPHASRPYDKEKPEQEKPIRIIRRVVPKHATTLTLKRTEEVN